MALQSLFPSRHDPSHKAQGSEFPAVVIPLARSHWHMLERQWLYTSITRGKRRVVLVGHPSAIERAARHVTGRRRLTSLPLWLRHTVACIHFSLQFPYRLIYVGVSF